MTFLRPSLKNLRVLAGEGDFHCYRLLAMGRRVFLFSKYLLTTVAYCLGQGGGATERTVAFVKGKNQLRYHRHVTTQLNSEFGPVQLFVSSGLSLSPEFRMLPRIPVSAVFHQFCLLTLLLLTGRRRYLNLYLLAFAGAVGKVVEKGLGGVKVFVCYNDQPYDVASILFALNNRKNCRTVVIQHGLVLNEKFYFPSVAEEFWAWGELSREHYRAWSSSARLLVKGRYADDARKKREEFILPVDGEPLRILIAPSHYHEEVKQILTSLNKVLVDMPSRNVFFAIKFHPSTRFIGLLKLWCVRHTPWLGEESDPMEALSDKCDVLVTKYSTSAVDFLLRGKPVFFLEPRTDQGFPSEAYGFELGQLGSLLCSSLSDLDRKNTARKKFLEIALNV